MFTMQFTTSWFSQLFEWVDSSAPVLRYPVLGHALWKYLAFGVWLLVGWQVITFTQRYLHGRIMHWLRNHRNSLSVRLIENLILPIRAVMILTLVFSGLQFFNLSLSHEGWHRQAYVLSVGVCLTIALVRLTQAFLWNWKLNYQLSHHEELNGQLYVLVDKGSQLFIIVVMSLMTLHNIGINITSLLASLSIGSLAVALAAQDTLSNLFGAVSILMDGPFKIGDSIKIDNIEGKVESIGLRSTRVRNNDGLLVTIPNKQIGNAVVVNISNRSNWKATQFIILDFKNTKHQLLRARQIIEEACRADSRLTSLSVGLKAFDEKGLKIEVIHVFQAISYFDYLEALHQINLKIKDEFDREGVSFSLPQSTIQLEKN